MTEPAAIDAATARELVARSCLALDEEDRAAYLALCADDFHYRIEVASPELRQRMVWLEHDREGFAELLGSLGEHLRRKGRLLRQLGATIILTRGSNRLALTSSFTALHTGLDGRTSLWAAGRYLDEVIVSSSGLRLSRRTVDLHTRDLGIGSHVPL